jgi:hypothetical protein
MSSIMDMPRFGDMKPRSFGAKLNYASDSNGMPRFGDINPRSFGAKLKYASDSTCMSRFGDLNPRSFGAKLNNVTTLEIPIFIPPEATCKPVTSTLKP